MPRTQRQRGFSLIELLIVIAIITIIAAIATVSYSKIQDSAHELAAKRELDTIYTAQLQHRVSFGKYAASLAELGPGNANLISKTLAGGEHNGYRYSLAGTPGGFSVTAIPSVAKPGVRSFYLDETRILRAGDPPNAQSEEAQ